MKNRAGGYRKNLSGEMMYLSFIPSPLPPKPAIEIDSEMLSLAVEAGRRLAALDVISKNIPNMKLYVSMYVRKEALMSSQIEGAQATLEDILNPSLEENANRDVTDVMNYIRATEYAVKRLDSLPLCCRLIRETHAVLMENVRGQEKNPGEFRHSQNWIGAAGSTIRTAGYIPPCPEDMETAMSDLEKYINDDADGMDLLIRTTLIHYQFETIHPFLDGNGRMGRLLITLFLMENKLLSLPSLYISYYLKKNRIEYYDRMSEVRKSGNYEQWVEFFLRAISECADNAVVTVEKLDALHRYNEEKIQSLGRAAKNSLKLFYYLEANPIIDIGKTASALGVAYNTVSSAIQRLEGLNILVRTSDKDRNRIFSYEAYLNILRDGT